MCILSFPSNFFKQYPKMYIKISRWKHGYCALCTNNPAWFLIKNNLYSLFLGLNEDKWVEDIWPIIKLHQHCMLWKPRLSVLQGLFSGHVYILKWPPTYCTKCQRCKRAVFVDRQAGFCGVIFDRHKLVTLQSTKCSLNQRPCDLDGMKSCVLWQTFS